MKASPNAATLATADFDLNLADGLRDVGNFFMNCRGSGCFLSPGDSTLLLGWLKAGVPVDTLLAGVSAGSKRLTADGRPIRNVRSIRRDIQKEVNAYLRHCAAMRTPREAEKGGQCSQAYYECLTALIVHNEGELRTLRADAEADDLMDWVFLCDETAEKLRMMWDKLEDPAHAPPASEMVPKLLSISSTFYEAVWVVMDDDDRKGVTKAAEEALSGWIRPMSAKSRQETLVEMARQRLREMLRLFDLQVIHALWNL